MTEPGALRVDFVFPRFKEVSGAERSILEFAAALARAGERPRIVCHQFHDSCRTLLVPGVELIESGARLDWSSNRYVNALFDYLRVLGLARHLSREADAWVLCGGPALPLMLRLLGRRRRVIYHCFEPPRALYQDRDDVLARSGWLRPLLCVALAVYRVFDRLLARRPGTVTTVGPFSAASIERAYGRPATYLSHGIDRARLDEAYRERDPQARGATLITVNSLHPRKRVDLIVRALAVLPEGLAGVVELIVVGGGAERGRLEGLAESLGVRERVRFAGFVDDSALPDFYRRAQCYVHAAREESLGLSVIEAAYCGLPVVAVAEGGVVDNVEDGVTGALVEATPEALAAGIGAVLADAEMARGMGERGRRLVAARHTWEAGAEQLRELIRRAL